MCKLCLCRCQSGPFTVVRYTAFDGKSKALFKSRNGLFKTDVAVTWFFLQKYSPYEESSLVSFILLYFCIRLLCFMVHVRTDFALGINFSGAKDDFYGD